MNKLIWLFFMFFAFTIVSCSDDDDEGVLDSQTPTVAISAPTDGQNYTLNGDADVVIDINFQVEDDLGLEEVKLWVTSPDGQRANVESWGVSDFLHDDKDFDKDYELTITSPDAGTYAITVEARDDQGNVGEDEISVMLSANDDGSSISFEGIEEGGDYIIGVENEVSFIIIDEQGIDSIYVALMTMEDDDDADDDADTLVTHWYGQDYFTDNINDNTNFTITEHFSIPNAAPEGEYKFILVTYRGGESIRTLETNFNILADPNARSVDISLTPPPGFDTNSPIYIAGDFQTLGSYTNDYDPAYELDYDEATGLYSITLYVSPDHDFNYRYSTIDAAGNKALEADETCNEVETDVYGHSYIYADGEDEINEDVSFVGFGDC